MAISPNPRSITMGRSSHSRANLGIRIRRYTKGNQCIFPCKSNEFKFRTQSCLYNKKFDCEKLSFYKINAQYHSQVKSTERRNSCSNSVPSGPG